jgi:hypothetical protein
MNENRKGFVATDHMVKVVGESSWLVPSPLFNDIFDFFYVDAKHVQPEIIDTDVLLKYVKRYSSRWYSNCATSWFTDEPGFHSMQE